MSLQLRVFTLILFCSVFLLNCASQALIAPVNSNLELPQDVPKEYHEKFQVKDTVIEAAQQPVISVVQTAKVDPPSKKKSKKKNRKERDVAKADPAPFTYIKRDVLGNPIWIGEQSVYEITYFGMPAGDFTIDVLPFKSIADRKVWHFKGTAISSAAFSLFYRLHDTVESFTDYEGFFSHRFHLLLDETKQKRDALELNDSEKAQTFYWNKWDRKEQGYSESKEYGQIQPFSQDSVSALFYLRTMSLPDNAVVTFPVVSEGKVWEAICTVVRREILNTPIGRMNAIVVKLDTKFQGVLRKNGDSFLWLSDDDRRVPLRLEAKVRIGVVVAALKKFSPGVSSLAQNN